MAQQTLIKLVDDLNGGPADETVLFALDRRHLVIDLAASNAAKLRAALAPFIDKARLVSGKRPNRTAGTRGTHAKTKAPRPQFSGTQTRTELRPAAKSVRAWARSQGIDVNPRGRISDDVMDRYTKASSSKAGRRKPVR